MKKLIVIAASLAVLSGCQTNYAYEPIVPNAPNLEMAQARCEMMSSSTQQGMIAFGSASYVAGAQLGNAIDNAIRADQFVKQCMTMSGWRRVPAKPKTSKPAAVQQPKYSPLTGKPYKGAGAFPKAPGKS
ncbi:lipoprotein [Rhizobium sp. OAE497]|uniref:lipoprotein n=1 Tax=Rhizobium sp. OAE497 TaxID=2663796 RepID=UPI0018F57D25